MNIWKLSSDVCENSTELRSRGGQSAVEAVMFVLSCRSTLLSTAAPILVILDQSGAFFVAIVTANSRPEYGLLKVRSKANTDPASQRGIPDQERD